MSVALGVRAVPRRTAMSMIRDYIALTKPRVVVLLEVTAVAAMVMANHGFPEWNLVLATVVGGWLAAGGAHAVNCWFDRDIDHSMGRTRNRPLPAGRIEPSQALGFGIALAAASFALLTIAVNLLTAALAMAAFLFYVLVYTMWLKRATVQNIVIGGAAGAIPPLVGWAAVQNRLTITPLFLFAIIFYWTPPHFWALALLIRGDYARARVPMLPVVAGDRSTRRQIVLYTLLLVVVTVLPLLTRSFGLVYLAGALVLDAGMLWFAVHAARHPSARSARRLFYYSMIYLALLFTVMAVDQVVGIALT